MIGGRRSGKGLLTSLSILTAVSVHAMCVTCSTALVKSRTASLTIQFFNCNMTGVIVKLGAIVRGRQTGRYLELLL